MTPVGILTLRQCDTLTCNIALVRHCDTVNVTPVTVSQFLFGDLQTNIEIAMK